MYCRKPCSSLLLRIVALPFIGALTAFAQFQFIDPNDSPIPPDRAVGATGTPSSTEEGASSASVDAPGLTIGYRNSQLAIEWPSSASGWVLEQSSDPTRRDLWACVPFVSAQTNAGSVVISLASNGRNMFYRLRRPAPVDVAALMGAWTFDQSDCHLAQDTSGHGNSLNVSNVVWSGGRVGAGALGFNGHPANSDGSRAWIRNDNYRLLPPQGQPFSVSLFFNPDTVTTGWRGLLGTDANGSNGWHVALHTSGPSTNEFVFASSGPGALNVTTSSQGPGRKVLLPGQWHELTATYDGNEGAIYLDSELLASGTGTLLASEQPLYIGGGVAGHDSFLGRIDEVRIYTNALTLEDISLAGQWHMDENSGTLLADSSIHGHAATLSDPAGWATGKIGAGVNLSNSPITIRNDWSDVLPPTGGSFGLSFWIYSNSLGTNSMGLMSCADGTNSGWRLALTSQGGGMRLRFWSTDAGGTLDLTAPVEVVEGVWSKVELTFNGGIATLYVNGRKIAASNGGIQGNTRPLVIGAVAGMPNFNGALDELRIYRRERDESEAGPVAKVMWETVMINSSTNLLLKGSGPSGRALSYSIVNDITPTNGTIAHVEGSPVVTYTAGGTKGPDAFTYTVSDGEFTSPPTTVVLSLVQPHWLSPGGGSMPPLDGSNAEHAWVAGPPEALDAIWRTNNYYDCFFYAPGEYQTTGWKYNERWTARPGCKHIGAGSQLPTRTVLKLVNVWESQSEGLFFGMLNGSAACDGFEVHNLRLDCNATNNPQYTVGEPLSIRIPLVTNTRVDSVTLRWNVRTYPGPGLMPNGRSWWQWGAARDFTVCTHSNGPGGDITNCISVTSTGAVDVVPVGMKADEITVELKRRATDIDFYSLADVLVAGADVSLPAAVLPNGSPSSFNTNSPNYSILRVLDGNEESFWVSGTEQQVDVILPLEEATTVSAINLRWYCHFETNFGQFGPASEYQIRARDPMTHQFYDVPLMREPRTAEGRQLNLFSNAVVTDRILIHLQTKELGVGYYGLREVVLQNGSQPIQPRVPTAPTSYFGPSFYILSAFDGYPSTAWTSYSQGRIGAILASGSNLKFTGLDFVGFGSKAGLECFVLTAVPSPSTPAAFGNVLVENCNFYDSARDNTEGVSVVSVEGHPYHTLTNSTVRNCTVTGLMPWFPFSQGFSSIHVENCIVSDCAMGVYFEPATWWGDNYGALLVRSNQFLNVRHGVNLLFHAAARFDSVTMLANEIVLNGSSGGGFGSCDTCNPGESGVITNVTVLNNIIRHADWSSLFWNTDVGLIASDIQNAVYGNNVIALNDPMRVRQCPSGYTPPPPVQERCDGVTVLPPTEGTYAQCLNVLPPGYRRTWFNNRDLNGTRLPVKHLQNGVDGLAAQQQSP